MKKLSYLLLSVLLILAACTQQEEELAPLSENMYRLSVATEGGVMTRAGAPEISGLKARYILEIYNNGQRYDRLVETTPVFNFRLMTKQTYDFLVWIDYTVDGASDYHYNTASLKAISVKEGDTYNNNDHSRDAFFEKMLGVTIETTSKDFGSLECKRPFAQLNIKITDWTETNSVVENTAIKPTSINVSFRAPNSFNVYDGSVSGDLVYTYDYTLNIADQTKDQQDLTCDYIFAPAGANGTFVSPVIIFNNADGDKVTDTGSYLNTLPIKRNYQTNVSGALISKKGKATITVDAEWQTPSIELTRPAEGTSSLYIKKDDTSYNPATGQYTIDASKVGASDTNLLLVFEGDFPNNITVIIPDNLPANISSIILDVNMTTGAPSITISNDDYSGTVKLKNELPTNNPQTTVTDLNIHLPNGSFVLSSGFIVAGNMTVWTKGSTFLMEEGAVINGTLTVKGGRAILNGIVKGIIYVYGDSQVDIVRNGAAKTYATSAIAQKGVSKWYGFGVGVNDAIGLALPGFTLPDFLNLSFRMNYAGAYAAFDFGNHNGGLNWKDLRNVRYDFYTASGTSAVGSAKLKKDLNITYNTPAELQAAMNKPVNDLRAELNKKTSEVNAMVEKYASVMPAHVSAALRAEALKLQNSVNYFNSQLPTVQLPDGPQIPLATILPAADNFDFSSVAKLIGKPGDKFNLLDIPAYINGSKPLSVYMIIDFLTGYKEKEGEVASLKSQKATLEADKATLNAQKATINGQLNEIKTMPEYINLDNQLKALINEYDAMPKPNNGPNNIIGIPSWVFVPAAKAEILPITNSKYFINKWSVAYGNPNAAETTKMNNCNTKIDAIEAKLVQRNAYYAEQSGALGNQLTAIDNQIKAIDKKINGSIENLFIDGLTAQIIAAEAQTSIFQGALEQMGIPKETVDAIVDVVITIEPYLGTVSSVANTINSTMEKIQSYNPWEYPAKISSLTPVTKMEVEAIFEYEAGKQLYLYSK